MPYSATLSSVLNPSIPPATEIHHDTQTELETYRKVSAYLHQRGGFVESSAESINGQTWRWTGLLADGRSRVYDIAIAEV